MREDLQRLLELQNLDLRIREMGEEQQAKNQSLEELKDRIDREKKEIEEDKKLLMVLIVNMLCSS